MYQQKLDNGAPILISRHQENRCFPDQKDIDQNSKSALVQLCNPSTIKLELIGPPHHHYQVLPDVCAAPHVAL